MPTLTRFHKNKRPVIYALRKNSSNVLGTTNKALKKAKKVAMKHLKKEKKKVEFTEDNTYNFNSPVENIIQEPENDIQTPTIQHISEHIINKTNRLIEKMIRESNNHIKSYLVPELFDDIEYLSRLTEDDWSSIPTM
jgi:K+-transporting ATPase c subunit